MPPGVILPDNVTAFPAAPAIAADKEKLDTLGGQISAMVLKFNELKRSLTLEGVVATKTRFAALLDQRRQAIEAAMDAWKARAGQIGVAAAKQVPALAGMGQFDLTSLQTQIGDEQSKLTALQSYYAAYKTAVETGQTPPAVPPELESGFLGISAGTIIAGIALLAAGAYFLWFREK